MGEPYILKYDSKIIKLFKRQDLKFGFDVGEKKITAKCGGLPGGQINSTSLTLENLMLSWGHSRYIKKNLGDQSS